MKKGLLAIIIFVISVFIPTVYAEQFEVLYKMENELKDNTFTIQLGLREASTMAVMSNIVYNQEKLEFVSLDANEYFTVTKSSDTANGAFKSFKILADSDYGFQKVYYANLTFRIKDGFQKGERTDIYFNNNQVATADEIIKTSPAMVYTLFYDKDGTVSYVVSESNFMTTLNIYLTNNWKTVLIGLFVLFGLFIFVRYYLIVKDIKIFRKKHEHNHIVEKMKFAKVPVNLQTVPVDDKPEKIRLAKVGKWFKKKQKEEPQVSQAETNDKIANLMSEEPVEEVKETVEERGYFVGNQNMGDDNQLPDDFSSFGEAESNYAYDDDKDEDDSEYDDDDAVNLDNLSNISLTDENNNNGTKVGILFLGLLVLTSLFNIKPVNALTDDEMDNLRNMILGNMTWSAEYDINNDNTIDMLDIIALKDIENITIIQDSITVEDSKPQNNFVLKSTSKYIRTTKQGQTKMRTTADGKWKHNNNNNGDNNYDPGETPSDDDPSGVDPIVKEPEDIDASEGAEITRTVHVTYSNGSGDARDITVKYGGGCEFDVYAPDEGHQALYVAAGGGKKTITGSYPTYHVKLYDIYIDMGVDITFGATSTINAKLKTGTKEYDYNNKAPGTTISQTVEYDEHYDITGVRCNGGFDNATMNGRKFSGVISNRSGTCTLQLKAKYYENQVNYNGSFIAKIYGNYGSTMKNVMMFGSDVTSKNMKLYCGSSSAISPKSVEWVKQTLEGYTAEGYRYLFDVQITGNDCELR